MVLVRSAIDEDMEAVSRIYAAHVRSGLGTFEEIPPTNEEMARRRSSVVGQGLPYIIADLDGEIVGFAYASAFRTRSGYRFTAEDSVYVAPKAVGNGIGRSLLKQLVAACEDLGLRQLVALIGDSENTASIALHQSAGFERCGLMRSVGFKHERWVDVVMMQRSLNGGDASPPNDASEPQALE